MEGPDLQDFNPVPAMQLWNGACKYRIRSRKATDLLTLVDMKSPSESEWE